MSDIATRLRRLTELDRSSLQLMDTGSIHNALVDALAEVGHLRTLLWKFVDAPIVAVKEDGAHAVEVSADLWHQAQDAVGYDEMGQ